MSQAATPLVTLADLGLTRSQSSRYQLEASIPALCRTAAHGGSAGGNQQSAISTSAILLSFARKVLTAIDLRHRQKLHTAGAYCRNI